MSAAATILHADLDAFFASVEQRDDPRLRGRPTIVGGGVVLAASYEARAYGIRSAMAGARARRLCPHARVVPPRWSAYVEGSRAVFALFRDTAPLVEGLSIDEAFLDVRGLERIAGTPAAIAVRLRRRVRDEVGLPITIGVARTKFLAKVASGVAKPDGLLVVAPEDERAFLHPLGVRHVWGVGPATAARLEAFGLRTVADLAAAGEAELVAVVGGAAGRRLHALARGRDPRPVRATGRRRSVGAQRALGRGPHSPEQVDAALAALVERVAGRMRAKGRAGRTVILRLRFGDFARASRSRTLPRPTAATRVLLATSRGLLAETEPEVARRGLTLIGVSVSNLDDHPQLVLPLEADHAALDTVLDELRERYGARAVTRGSLLRHPPGLATWLHPDEEE